MSAELKPHSMSGAPRDGTIVRLLVKYDRDDGWSPLEDADEAWSIGFNSLENTGEDRWQIVGWDWSSDRFTEGVGTPIGWLPFHGEQHVQAAPDAWRPISEHDGSDMLVDLWASGHRWTDFRLEDGRRWARKEGYPAITRVLTVRPSHFLIVPAGPESEGGQA